MLRGGKWDCYHSIPHFGVLAGYWNEQHLGGLIALVMVSCLSTIRKGKLAEAKERFEIRNGGQKRFEEVRPDYSNLDPWLGGCKFGA